LKSPEVAAAAKLKKVFEESGKVEGRDGTGKAKAATTAGENRTLRTIAKI